MTDDALLAAIAAHRPYGLNCKCGRDINSDEDWALHFAKTLGSVPELLEQHKSRRWIDGDGFVWQWLSGGNVEGWFATKSGGGEARVSPDMWGPFYSYTS